METKLPLGPESSKKFFATLKELRRLSRLPTGDATLSGLRLQEMNACSPGLPKRNPGLELANAFSVVRRTLSFHTVSVAVSPCRSRSCHGLRCAARPTRYCAVVLTSWDRSLY